MDKMRKIAMDYHNLAPDDIKKLAKEFFKAMDYDRDGKISTKEFLAFMREQGYEQYRDRHLFEELDRKGLGRLDFEDVMTLFYIVKSGRPFCERCRKLVTSMYFTCVRCFQNSSTPFSLCPDCYINDAFDHKHTLFLDSYTMLETQRLELVARRESQNQRAASGSSSRSNPYESQYRQNVLVTQGSSKKQQAPSGSSSRSSPYESQYRENVPVSQGSSKKQQAPSGSSSRSTSSYSQSREIVLVPQGSSEKQKQVHLLKALVAALNVAAIVAGNCTIC